MVNKKVSVVVPIYKVEKYLKRCVDSIVNQTYPNLEIILVNDGSPDNCGQIAINYEKMDNRIKVVHKENGGLSDARNYGIQHVTGDFVLFVDSDDWLELNMIEKMVFASLTFKADIVQSAFYYAFDDHLLIDYRHNKKDDPPTVLDNKTLMTELVVNEKVKNFAWGKLYKKHLILDITFEKGVLFEDVFWAHKVMQRVNKYVILHQPLCFYFQRSDSIVSTYTPKNLDIIKGLKERQCFIEEFYEELSLKAYKVLFKTMLIHYNLLLVNRNKDKNGFYKKEIQMDIKNNYNKFKYAVGNDKNLKKQLMLFSIHPYLNILFLLMGMIFRKFRLGQRPVGLERINL